MPKLFPRLRLRSGGGGSNDTANFTLELTCPRAPGAAGTGYHADHRIYRQYPGVPYRYFAAAVGGVPPFVFSIAGQPSGMTINSDTGEVTWSNPTSGTHTNITVTVTDQASSTDDATYDLEVTTTGFFFINSVSGNDTTGSGTLASPWASLDKIYDQTAHDDYILYMRTGTYPLTGITVTTGADPDQPAVVFEESAGRITNWLAYPGETVVVDIASNHVEGESGRQPAVRLIGSHIFVDGIEFLDGYHKCLWLDRVGRYGSSVINSRFISLGPGAASRNCACIEYTSLVTNTSYFDLCVNNYAEDVGISNDEISIFKMYTSTKSYMAFNTGDTDLDSTECIAYKDSCEQFMNYRNEILAVERACRGNMNNTAVTTGGEWWFNRYKGGNALTGFSMAFNQQGNAGPMYWNRNTLEGSVVAESVGAGDGPFTFKNNVLINAQGGESIPFIYSLSVTAPGQIVCTANGTPTGTQNLAGASGDGIVDANGLLQGSYRTSYLGSWGHEIS